MKKVPTNKTNFKEIIETNCYYVDKTEFIESLIDSHKDSVLFARPRRFGKTLTMSMLENFFSIELKNENKNLFKGLYIEKSNYYNLRGTKPVIRLSLKGIQADNFESFYNLFQILVSNIYEDKYKYIYENLDDINKAKYDKIRSMNGTQEDFQMAIPNLIIYLKKIYKESVLLLIDEYDAPIQRAYSLTEDLDDENGFYKKVINFLKTVFTNSAKDNDDLFMAVFTGVLRVSQESIFSDLNNFKAYPLMDSPMKEYFGFSETETNELLNYFGLGLTNEVKNMYDGYIFNKVNLYNPWSILNYAEDKVLKSYWVNTSSNSLIKEMLKNAESNVKNIIESLVQGNSTIFVYDEMLTYKNLRNNNDLNSILNMLFASGYLTYDKTLVDPDFGDQTYIKVPNREVNELLVKIMQEDVYGNESSSNITKITNAIRDNNKELLESTLNDMLISTSFMDHSNESGYHNFMLGIFTSYLNNDNFIVKSNREAGNGRFDVMIERVDRRYGYIFEFKIAGNDEDMEIVAKDALNQINTKEYYKELELEKIKDIRKVSIVFSNKCCIVR